MYFHTRKFCFYLAFAFCVIGALAVLSLTSADVSADTHTLVGAGNADNGAIWDTGTAPEAGDDLKIVGAYNLVLNQAINYGNITLEPTYSGVCSQGTVNFGFINFYMAGGTYTGRYANTMTCSGSFIKTAGTFTNGVSNLIMNGTGVTYSLNAGVPGKVSITGHVTLMGTTGTYAFSNSGTSIITGMWCVRSYAVGGGPNLIPATSYYENTGEITRTGTGKLLLIFNDRSVYGMVLGNVSCPVEMTQTSASDNYVISLGSVWRCPSLLLTGSTVKTLTLNLSGYDLITNITVGARGVVKNSLSNDSSIICKVFDGSTAASVFIPGNITLNIIQDGYIKLKAGDSVESVEVDGSLILFQDTIIINELSFINLTASHPYGLYINGTRESSVTTDANGSYSLGSGVFAWDNATLKITPVITFLYVDTPAGSDARYAWYDQGYRSYFAADATVTWSVVFSETWLGIDTTGTVYAMPQDLGSYDLTIVATASNGETATYQQKLNVLTGNYDNGNDEDPETPFIDVDGNDVLGSALALSLAAAGTIAGLYWLRSPKNLLLMLIAVVLLLLGVMMWNGGL